MAQPVRGPVEIQGVTTRHNRTADRTCTACHEPIPLNAYYERVMRLEGDIESYSQLCFVQEFGERSLYGA